MINNFFSVYDMKGHLCPFDTGLVQKIYCCIFLDTWAIYEENSLPEGGIMIKYTGANKWMVYYWIW